MKFKDFLTEKAEKHAVLAFGRMNPPTVGHEKLVNKVKEIAKTVGGTAHVVVSHSQDTKKNPLTPEQKVKHAKRAFSGVHVTSSDASAPNFLAQAAKLHKQGVTHFHMVGGADRTDEFHKLLHKYNGVKGPHGHFDFKHITVHSAGERDPDAEGVEGMSASKMREHASKGNFKEFRKGVPSKMSDEHAKELYHHVRQGMNVKEDINLEFSEILTEGVHDKGIFKAVFLFGGPGSGKDYVLSKTLDGNGLTEINSDKAFEFLMDKENLDMRMPESEKDRREVVRGRAKNMTELRQRLALFGRNGLIINGTGDDPEKISRIKERLENLGYDTSAIMVNTADEVSKQRNIERGQSGGRTVPENIRKEKWDSVQNARPEFAKMFGDSYQEFDNSEDLRVAPPEVKAQKEDEMLQLFKNVQKFVNKPPKNPNAKLWVASELEKKDTSKIDQTKEVTPHSGSQAAEEARRMGLQYYGFGRYGQKGKVTHRSVHDKLVQVSSMNEDLRQWFDPNHPKGGWKRINTKGEVVGDCAREPGEPKPKCMSNAKRAMLSKKERASAVRAKRKHDPNPERKGAPINVSNFGKGKLNEAVTVSITADTPEEINQMFSQMFNSPTSRQEEYSFSSKDAENMLLLGTKKTVTEVNDKSVTFSNDDIAKIFETHQEKYIVDKNNKPRVFLIRANAAKEAHQKNGQVVKTERGYLVKLRENEDVQVDQRNVCETRTVETSRAETSARSSERRTEVGTRSSSGLLTEESNYAKNTGSEKISGKITISEIYRRKKEKAYKESIDKGIEPGVSMAGSGESIARDMGEKTDKKGKITVVKELTGDETTASIGDKAEDELKKKGISLTSFKKRNFV